MKNLGLIVLFAAFTMLIPTASQAAYTMHNRTFSTFGELVYYMQEYLRAWREVYGYEHSSDTDEAALATETHVDDFEVRTSSARDVDADSARLIGKLDFEDSREVTVWFAYGTSKTAMTNKTEVEVLDGRGLRTFDRKVRDLEQNTRYYYQVIGENEDGIRLRGSVRYFTTDIDYRVNNSAIRLSTGSPTNVDDTRATIRGTLYLSKEPYAYVWFIYSDDEDDLYKDTRETRRDVDDSRTYEYRLRSLEPEETYWYRFVGEDTKGTRAYGALRSFKTARERTDEKPTLSVTSASDIGPYTAEITGDVDMNDFNDGVAFFAYGEDRDSITSIPHNYTRFSRISERGDDRQLILLDDDLDRDETFTETLKYLDFDTMYYYAIGVEYENDDGDEEILLSYTRQFRTKRP